MDAGAPPLPSEAGFPELAPDLRITVAGSAQPLLHAHFDILKGFSSCVAGLPAARPGSEPCWYEWDLSGLVVEGDATPVSVDVVTRWLRLIYSRYSNSLEQADSWPTRLDADTRALLLFADAVGTRRGVVQQAAQRLVQPVGTAGTAAPTLCMDVGGPLREMELLGRTYCLSRSAPSRPVDGISYFATSGNGAPQFTYNVCNGEPGPLKAHVTEAVEAWLYLACRLELMPLARLLLRWVRAQAAVAENTSLLLYGDGGGVFSPRVVAHLPRELLLRSFLEGHLLVGADKEQAVAAAEAAKIAATAAARTADGSRVVEGVLRAARGLQRPPRP